jgi:hypothetical protein
VGVVEDQNVNLHDEELARIARELAAKLFKEAETKRVFKEALTEWLDNKYAEFGRWTLRGLFVAIFGALVIFIMWSQGYTR